MAKVTPYLDGEKSITHWSVDTNDPDKILTIEGNGLSPGSINELLSNGGFKALGEVERRRTESVPDRPLAATYYPLLLILGYLIAIVALIELSLGRFDGMRAMSSFMGGFFVVFSFFKLLDLRGFTASYQTYDVLARRVPAYGYFYPFVELLLGIAYVVGFQPVVTNLLTLGVMLLGIVGVTQALLAKRRIQCACLGTVFNLPMSYVTFVEDGLMAGMALAMLVGLFAGQR